MRSYKLILPLIVLAQLATAQSAAVPSRISELHWILGSWSCDGQFVSSGKKISADLTFESVLDGKWILFRHDDRPPFQYHAMAEWGWDAKAQEFVSTIQDSTGGVRVFRARPPTVGKIVWDGGSLAPQDPPDQRFEFERMSATEFRVSYSVQRNGAWTKVDESVCRKQ